MPRTFTANKITVLENPPFITFADLQPSGAIRNSLVLSDDDADAALELEFNNQTCGGDRVRSIELSDNHLRITFKAGCGIREDAADETSAELSELDVAFEIDPKRLQQMASALAWLAHGTKVFRYTGPRLKS